MPPFVSHAQNFEDVLLWRALKDVTDGFYIDVGAWEPDHDSVTRAFSERGWRGVNIEPVAIYHAMLEAGRPLDVNLQVAVGAVPGETVFFHIEDTGLSTTDASLAETHAAKGFTVTRTDVAVMTLAEICRLHAPGDIHFLKIDCEGAERDVLAGADFVGYRPWIVLAEATVPNSQEQNHQPWEGLLLAADYRFVWFDGLNRFYVAAEHFERLAPVLAVPPNVFDEFVRAREVRDPMAPVLAELAALRRELREMRAELRPRGSE
jgi:FkbM family methyltransferase